MNADGVLAAIKAFKDAVKGDVVDETTLSSRAAICSKCPKRRIKSSIVSRVSKILGDLANKHRVPSEISKYSCGVCGCSLMLLLPATEKDLHKDSPAELKKRPLTCWMRRQ